MEEREVEVPLDVNVEGKKCPWAADGGPMFLRSRWSYWRRRFRLVTVSKNHEKWSEGDKQLALEAATLMEGIEAVVEDNAVSSARSDTQG